MKGEQRVKIERSNHFDFTPLERARIIISGLALLGYMIISKEVDTRKPENQLKAINENANN